MGYTAFADTPDAVDVRLVVRRVRPTSGSQLALDVVFDHHAFITDLAGDLLEVEADHRRHAVIEKVIEDRRTAAAWSTCPRRNSPPTPPGSPWPASPTTSAAGAPPSPAAGPPRPRRPCGASCSPSPPASCTPPAGCTYASLQNWPWQQTITDLPEAIAGITPALT